MSKTSITVTKESYPTLFKAFQAMQNDNGISVESTYVVPAEWAHLVKDAEKALAQLTEEELETFCIGDQDEAANVIVPKYEDKIPIDTAGRLLNAFFDGWDWDD